MRDQTRIVLALSTINSLYHVASDSAAPSTYKPTLTSSRFDLIGASTPSTRSAPCSGSREVWPRQPSTSFTPGNGHTLGLVAVGRIGEDYTTINGLNDGVSYFLCGSIHRQPVLA
jgi:hypothetical protein